MKPNNDHRAIVRLASVPAKMLLPKEGGGIAGSFASYAMVNCHLRGLTKPAGFMSRYPLPAKDRGM